jgi:hypothetical protein
MDKAGLVEAGRAGGWMKTLFGMFGCTQISTLLLVLPAAGAIAATQPQKNSQPLVDVTVESITRVANAQPCAHAIEQDQSQLHMDRSVSKSIAMNISPWMREARATVDGNDVAQSVAPTPQLDSAVRPYTQRQRTFKR